MRALQKSVRELVLNAEYYLEASYKHPSPTKDGVRLLLLLIGWDNIVTAREEIDAWARDADVDPKVYTSHERKFSNMPVVLRVQIESGGKAKETKFSTPADFKKLRLMCQYGLDKDTKNVKEIFKSGWHFDTLERALSSKIGWTKVSIASIEGMEKHPKVSHEGD